MSSGEENKPVPLADEDDPLLGQLGLPFYYRHTAPLAQRRALYWGALAILLLLLFINLVFMPCATGSLLCSIHTTLFRGWRRFESFEEGGRVIFNEMFVLAIIFSGVLAPLAALNSLIQERLTGTIEFLLLSPMTRLSIVMGKMIAPAYVLHLMAGVMLAVGLFAGALSGYKPTVLLLGLLAVVSGCLTLNALGIFCASLTAAYRGMIAIAGLLIAGTALSTMPFAAVGEPVVGFLAYISPWTASDALFWHTKMNTNYDSAQFCGTAGAAKFFMLGFHLLATTLLVWAAKRKLERPEKPALPYWGWLVLWGAAAGTALGTSLNRSIGPFWRFPFSWAMAAVIMGFGGAGAVILALLDHPHHRETILAAEHELLTMGRTAAKQPWRLAHAFFVTALAAGTALGVLYAVYHLPVPGGISWIYSFSIAAGCVVLVFFFALAFEAGAVSFNTPLSRWATSAVAIVLLIACFIAPLVHFANLLESCSLAASFYKQYAEREKTWLAELNRLAGQYPSAQGYKLTVWLKPKTTLPADAELPEGVTIQHISKDNPLPAGLNIYWSAGVIQVSGGPTPPPPGTPTNPVAYLTGAAVNYESFRANPDFKRYFEGLNTVEDAEALLEQIRSAPLALIWHFEPKACLLYPSVFSAVVAALLIWRWLAYRRLKKIAAAVHVAKQALVQAF